MAVPSEPAGPLSVVPAAILHHRGHGPAHWDVVLGAGAACPTWALAPGPRGWRWRAQPPHRRRYLAFRGPVPGGRGCVAVAWRGPARCCRLPGGVRLLLGGAAVELRPGGVVLPATAPHCPPWAR